MPDEPGLHIAVKSAENIPLKDKCCCSKLHALNQTSFKNWPRLVYGGTMKNEKASNDCAVIQRAADSMFLKHRSELVCFCFS